MEDSVDNGMIIYIIFTEQIIAVEFFIEKFNYIFLYFNIIVKRCIEIFFGFFLGKNRFCYEEFFKIFKGYFFLLVCDLGEIYVVLRFRFISYFFGKFKSFDCLIVKLIFESYYF